MGIKEFKRECSRLFQCKSLKDSYELFDFYLEMLFQTSKLLGNKNFQTRSVAEASIVIQMVFTKTAHLKKIIEGISYRSKDGSNLNQIIDPTFIGMVIRNLFETIGMFNLVYIEPNSEDEKLIHYNLWAISGLKYRQRFGVVITSSENELKLEAEIERIKELKNQIFSTDIFQNLDEKNQNKIKTRIKQKDYKIRFDGESIKFLDWKDLPTIMGMKEEVSTEIYTYLSQYAHPSNVSVFQFSEMFEDSETSFDKMVNFQLKYAFMLLSIFIADIIKLFPDLKSIFEEMPLRDQIVIDFHNNFARDIDSSINEPWKRVDDYFN